MRILPAKSVLYVNYSTVLKNWQCELIFSEKIMIDLSRYDCLRWQAVNVQSPFLYVESNQPSATLLVLWWQHVHVTAMLFNKVDMANVTNYLSIAESTFAKFLNSRVAVNPGFFWGEGLARLRYFRQNGIYVTIFKFASVIFSFFVAIQRLLIAHNTRYILCAF